MVKWGRVRTWLVQNTNEVIREQKQASNETTKRGVESLLVEFFASTRHSHSRQNGDSLLSKTAHAL